MRKGREPDYSFICFTAGISASSVSLWMVMFYGDYEFSISEKMKVKDRQ